MLFIYSLSLYQYIYVTNLSRMWLSLDLESNPSTQYNKEVRLKITSMDISLRDCGEGLVGIFKKPKIYISENNI